jgi:hypothetical protein
MLQKPRVLRGIVSKSSKNLAFGAGVPGRGPCVMALYGPPWHAEAPHTTLLHNPVTQPYHTTLIQAILSINYTGIDPKQDKNIFVLQGVVSQCCKNLVLYTVL